MYVGRNCSSAVSLSGCVLQCSATSYLPPGPPPSPMDLEDIVNVGGLLFVEGLALSELLRVGSEPFQVIALGRESLRRERDKRQLATQLSLDL